MENEYIVTEDNMHKILMIHTGGTISMQENEQGVISKNQHNPLLEQVAGREGDVEITQKTLFNVSSPSMDTAKMLKLSQLIDQRANEFDGIVVTHGTDTLEETAYFLDCTVTEKIAVVVTGAMRSTDQLGTDALINIKDAISVSADKKTASQGVVVVLNSQIFAAKYVTKTHTTNLATFQAPQTGMIGEVNHGQVTYFVQQATASKRKLDHLVDHLYLVKAYAGMDDTLLRMLDSDQTNGIVIEAFGAGNLPAKLMPVIESLHEHHIPMILTSRTMAGAVAPIYGYDGGGQQLAESGLIFAGALSGQKAMIKLQVGLSSGLSGSELQAYFEDDNHDTN
jgi:L-asparaginase